MIAPISRVDLLDDLHFDGTRFRFAGEFLIGQVLGKRGLWKCELDGTHCLYIVYDVNCYHPIYVGSTVKGSRRIKDHMSAKSTPLYRIIKDLMDMEDYRFMDWRVRFFAGEFGKNKFQSEKSIMLICEHSLNVRLAPYSNPARPLELHEEADRPAFLVAIEEMHERRLVEMEKSYNIKYNCRWFAWSLIANY